MAYVNPIRAKRLARRQARAAAVNAQTVSALAATTELVGTYRAALEAVKAVTEVGKAPNGTTKRIGRIASEALATA